MTRADVMMADDTATDGDRASPQSGVMGGTTPASWDPYEVWLTRVKLPRDLAQGRVLASASSTAPGLSD